MTQVTEPTLLDRLREQRTKLVDAWADFITARETERAPFEERSNTPEFAALAQEARDQEIEAFRTAEAAFKVESDKRKLSIVELDARISDQEDIVRRRNDAAAAASPSVEITREPMTYRSDNAGGENGLSYYRDLALVHGPGITLQTGGTRDQAQARLTRHGQEMEVEMPKRAKAAEERSQAQFVKAEQEFLRSHRDSRVARLQQETRDGISYSPFERRVTPNTAQGYGGYFSPPTWLVDQYIPGLRAHRVAAGLPRQMDLPPGTDSINIPKLSTLTKVGYQQANNSGLVSQDWTDTFVQANVKTIGGYSDVALQLLEQSPGAIVDEVITVDLLADYDRFEDGEVLAGDGLNASTLNGGHLTGIYPYTNWTGTNNVTYTDASPTGQHFISVPAVMASKIAATRFSLENFKVVMHGRRWFWFSSALDAYGRPLGESVGGSPSNLVARIEGGLQSHGLVGSLPYVADAPVYIDNNVSTADTTGGGSGQDYAVAGLWDDAWLFRGALRTDVFREVLSGSLGVRFRVYSYEAFLVRYGQSFAVATGSGFAAPTGSVSSLTF